MVEKFDMALTKPPQYLTSHPRNKRNETEQESMRSFRNPTCYSLVLFENDPNTKVNVCMNTKAGGIDIKHSIFFPYLL